MKRYFFECSYDGTNYSGWQIQPNAKTIQEEIENRLSQIYSNEKIEITGCGRTDAGVHAKQSFFHVDLKPIMTIEQLQYKLNYMLPADIAIEQILEVASDAHARFDATERTYHYYLHHKKQPFHANNSWYHPIVLNVEAMNKAATILLGKHDFTSFSKLHTDVNNNFCEVYHAEWKVIGDQLCFEITANRFLRNMVRAIVGTLIEIGKGEIKVDDMKIIMDDMNRSSAGHSVPAKGLFLYKVAYPFIK
ncbi:MAG: tRNA pseudouridine(38-40) synthase TruA [Brumimicrobium sp.]|nr:tRNA pseudouridine(38-40) synthase TruA [Brumimicrobium sp.]MCO5269089.1 tRNA pseudouridine(38-40) synthase TruA [Brumimicrobium sp.]